MLLSEFLKDKFAVDVQNNQCAKANEIKSVLATWKPTPPLDKELSQLSDEEILVVFGALYPIPKGTVRFATEVLDRALKDMEGYR